MNLKMVDADTGEEVPLPAIKTYLTAHLFPDVGEDYSGDRGVSETVPDQSLSISQIMTRFASGQSVDLGLDGTYEDEEDPILAPDWEHMDLADREAYLAEVQEEISRLQNKRYDPSEKVTPEPAKPEPPKEDVGKVPPQPGPAATQGASSPDGK